MVKLKKSQTLCFSFPTVHRDAKLNITFHRTLRVPDDGRLNALPPGFEPFSMEHVLDYSDRLPTRWRDEGGFLMPMYQSEAMWMSFDSPHDYPFAVKVACGRCCAITGNVWEEGLVQGERRTLTETINLQNYVVTPEQPWLDGFNVGNRVVRQFVATPLNSGMTVEEQLTGNAQFGGIQIQVVPLDVAVWEAMKAREMEAVEFDKCFFQTCYSCVCEEEMGLAAGGRIRQEIYKDERQLDEWDLEKSSRVFVHLLNADQWTEVTGKSMPHQPFDTETYNRLGLPWFDYYAEKTTVAGSDKLAKVKSIAEWDPNMQGGSVPEAEVVIKHKAV